MNIIPFDSARVPAAISTLFAGSAGDLVGNAGGGGFPVMSIKGKVFHISRGGERTLVTKPGEDDPAASIEVVILRANPNRSKVYYASGYQEGSDSKPTCYSNSGLEPESDAQEPQAKKCATCTHNQWGSRITDNGAKGKACSDSRRLAIATLDTPNDPILLRVPAASMKSLEEYGKILAARGVPPQAVVTKIGFDYSVAHPALTFKPIGLIGDAEQLTEIKAASDGDVAAQIVGTKPVAAGAEAGDGTEAAPAIPAAAAPVATKAPAAKPAPAPAKPSKATDAAVNAAVAAAATTKKVAVVVEAPPAAAPAAAGASLESQIESMIDGMDFDD
jgi:hypothetical protein